MLSRRRFLIGATGIAAIPLNYYEEAYSFLQNHNEPLLIPPRAGSPNGPSGTPACQKAKTYCRFGPARDSMFAGSNPPARK